MPHADAASDTVRVARAIPASPATVWQALIDPPLMAHWRGRLSESLDVGGLATLDLGDGDFSVLEVLRADRPATLEYAERFMGIGPKKTVTWRLVPVPGGCLVTVNDRACQRTSSDALAARM